MSIETSLERIAVALENLVNNQVRVPTPTPIRVMDPCHDNGKVHVATAEKPVKTTGLFDQAPAAEEPKKAAKPKRDKAPQKNQESAEVVTVGGARDTEKTKVSEDDVRAAMTKLVTAPGCGTAPAIKILKSYGVSKVSELSEADYSRIHAEFLAAIPQG